MPEPFLDAGDVGIVLEGIRGRCPTQRLRTDVGGRKSVGPIMSTNSNEAIFMRHLGNTSAVVRRVVEVNE